MKFDQFTVGSGFHVSANHGGNLSISNISYQHLSLGIVPAIRVMSRMARRMPNLVI